MTPTKWIAMFIILVSMIVFVIRKDSKENMELDGDVDVQRIDTTLTDKDKQTLICLKNGSIMSLEMLGGDAWRSGKCHIFRMQVNCSNGIFHTGVFKPQNGWGCNEDCRAEIGAYAVDKLLGLEMVPIAAEREIPFFTMKPLITNAIQEYEDKIRNSASKIEKNFAQKRLNSLYNVLNETGTENVRGCVIEWLGDPEKVLKDASPQLVLNLEASWKEELLSPLYFPIDEYRYNISRWISNVIVFDSLIDNRDRWSGSNMRAIQLNKDCWQAVLIDNSDGFRLPGDKKEHNDVHFGPHAMGMYSNIRVCMFPLWTLKRLFGLLDGVLQSQRDSYVNSNVICTQYTIEVGSSNNKDLLNRPDSIKIELGSWITAFLRHFGETGTADWLNGDRKTALNDRVRWLLRAIDQCESAIISFV